MYASFRTIKSTKELFFWITPHRQLRGNVKLNKWQVTGNIKHNLAPIKNLNVSHNKITTFGTLVTSKTIMLTCRNFNVYLHTKKWAPFLTSFVRYCKDIANLLLWVLFALSCLPIIIVSPCRTLWSPKCQSQLLGKFDVYLLVKNQLHL